MPVIEVENLRKAYGDVVAVEDVSFSVEAGEIFGVLGPNGAEKTTTVEMMSGLRTADAGRIEVLGLDPIRQRDEVRRRVGVQLQEAALQDRLKVGEALELYASFYDDPAGTEELLELLGLHQKRGTAFGDLSGGQRQRLSIALALVGQPEIAVLDELTTGLDPVSRRDTWALVERIRDRGVTVVLVTHFMEEAERLCDRVAVIDKGRVVAVDTPEALAERTGAGRRLRFVPSVPIDDAVLTALPAVSGVTHDRDGFVVVEGSGFEVLVQVVTTLAERGVDPQRLRVEQASLEDAFVELTA